MPIASSNRANAMYVCICNAVTEREVRHAVQLGADNLDDLKEGLGVATCCGKCSSCAKGIIREEKKLMREMQNAGIAAPV